MKTFHSLPVSKKREYGKEIMPWEIVSSKKVDTHSITKATFYYAEGHYTRFAFYKFLTKVPKPPQGCSPVPQILAECQVQSLVEVYDLRIRTLGDSPATEHIKVASLQMYRGEHHSWSLLIYSPVAISQSTTVCGYIE